MTRAALLLLMCFGSLLVFAQKSAEEIVKKYSDFKKNHPGVRVQLLFNQERYAPGDTVWFKAYFLNNDMSRVKGRQLLDLSLVTPDGSVSQHFLFGVTEGVGFNQFVLPETSTPGIYRVAAYSSWMRNFSPPPVFYSDLRVVAEKEIHETPNPPDRKEFSLNIIPDVSAGIVTVVFSAREGSMLRYQDLHLAITHRDGISLAKTFRQGMKGNVAIDVKAAPGVSHVSIIDKIGRVIAYESFNIPDAGQLQGTGAFKVSIANTRGAFKTRGRATLTVSVTDKDDRPVQGEFMMKVVNLTMLDRAEAPFDQQLVASELNQREPWNQVLSGRRNDVRFDFTTNLTRKGTAYMTDGAPLPGGATIVFYLQQNDVVLQAQTSPGGKFTLVLPDIVRRDELVAFAEVEEKNIEDLTIRWNEQPIQLQAPPPSQEGAYEDKYGVFASTKKLIDKSFGFFGSSEAAGPVKAPIPDEPSELETRAKGADLSVDVQKYVSFGTMDELIREIIPSLLSRTVKGKTIVQVGLREPMKVSTTDPLYIIDGVVTRNTRYFLAMKPADIITVKLIITPNKLIPLGLIGKNGIVIVETIKGNARPPVEPWQVVECVSGPVPFSATNYSEADPHRPQFRSTIFWAPTVETDASGKAAVAFFCSDDVGSVLVTVHGLTKDGKPFSGTETFKMSLGDY